MDKETPAKYGATGWPTVVFTDRKGDAIKKSVGAVPVERFLSIAQDAGKDAGKPRPSKDYKTLTSAKEDLDEALEKEKPSKAISAIAKIEKVGRKGRILDAALAAKEKLTADGNAAVEAAVALSEEDAEKAVKDLKALLREYKGLDAVEEATRAAITSIEEKAGAEK